MTRLLIAITLALGINSAFAQLGEEEFNNLGEGEWKELRSDPLVMEITGIGNLFLGMTLKDANRVRDLKKRSCGANQYPKTAVCKMFSDTIVGEDASVYLVFLDGTHLSFISLAFNQAESHGFKLNCLPLSSKIEKGLIARYGKPTHARNHRLWGVQYLWQSFDGGQIIFFDSCSELHMLGGQGGVWVWYEQMLGL